MRFYFNAFHTASFSAYHFQGALAEVLQCEGQVSVLLLCCVRSLLLSVPIQRRKKHMQQVNRNDALQILFVESLIFS